MEIILMLGYVPLIAYLLWQSYLLSQYRKITIEQTELIKTLKPFQVLFATLRGGKFLVGNSGNKQIKLIKKHP